MKIEKITENKIRIIIDTNELIEKNLNLNSIVKNTDAAQELFKSILEEAKKHKIIEDAVLIMNPKHKGFIIETELSKATIVWSEAVEDDKAYMVVDDDLKKYFRDNTWNWK